MQIRVVRFRVTGGFAGLARGVEVDATELSVEEHEALECALDTGEVARADGARDLFIYELDLDTDVGGRQLSFDELNAPAALSGLVQRLAKRARPVPP